MAIPERAVYFFGGRKADGRAKDRNLLGGKGANLAEMTRIGLPVPAGFTISTEVCTSFYENRRRFPAGLEDEVRKALGRVEGVMGAEFGDPDNPLLLSVRSGSRVSMPGMMDTVLNLGLNDTTVQGLIERTRNPRFAYDSYRRFVQMYGDVVLGLRPESSEQLDPFERILEERKKRRKAKTDQDLTALDLKELVARFKDSIRERTGRPFPEDPWEQLWGAVGAVFGSWMNERALTYRKLNGIPAGWGTAVNVQAMVFGNMGDDCATGVAFTRNPANGDDEFYGEFLINAQGEDVVAGVRTPAPIRDLKGPMPRVYRELMGIQKRLEKHYRDMQDVEFTVQSGKLWMLQTRAGKRTGKAAVKIAVDMVSEGLIKPQEAVARVQPEQIEQFLSPIFDTTAYTAAAREKRILAQGLPAGPGAASGRIALTAEAAREAATGGDPVVLVRHETSPEDIDGMAVSVGILTARGGMTSHAALVARQMGKVCVVGCPEIQVDYKVRRIKVAGRTMKEGDWISIDGSTGDVIEGHVKTSPSEVVRVIQGRSKSKSKKSEYGVFQQLMKWADETRTLRIRANADQPDQAKLAVAFGAEGIGLCRTEHMFFGERRIDVVREMILAGNADERRAALKKLLPMQRKDFAGLFRAMRGFPVTVRLLDPPLHEFLPHKEKDIKELAQTMGVKASVLHARVANLQESNPMLGHRGCRLGIVYPEITEMQAQAIFEAACDVRKEGKTVRPEIMIPLVGMAAELREQEAVVRRMAEQVFKRRKMNVAYLVGTMIELPRAALTADRIAEHAEFFSFGTNDLTQTTFGISRDDAGSFLPQYVSQDIIDQDPFVSIDVDGVGELLRIGTELGRKTRPDLKVGICGEHGGDPASVKFVHRQGLNYASCSPYRLPIARLAAAHAALEDGTAPTKPGSATAKAKSAAKKPAAKAKPAAKKPAAKKPAAKTTKARTPAKPVAKKKAPAKKKPAGARKPAGKSARGTKV